MIEVDGGSEKGLEADLLAVAERRDRAAFARLFAFYAPRVKAYLRRLGTEDAAVEDLVQEVMLTMWRRAHLFAPGRGTLSTWVFTIARNKRVDARRRERYAAFEPEAATALLDEPDPTPAADGLLASREMSELVARALERLPEDQAEVVRIFYYDEKPHSVIAAELGLPFGTVKSRLRLALGKLRTMLGGTER
jgi:RNA polymerase sigma-70 factor (ECF subfamily)